MTPALDFSPLRVDDAASTSTLEEAQSMSSPTSTARGRYSGFPSGLFRLLSDLRRAVKPYGRRMTTKERRRFAREAAKDPRVEQALQELYAERPYLRNRERRRSALRR